MLTPDKPVLTRMDAAVDRRGCGAYVRYGAPAAVRNADEAPWLEATVHITERNKTETKMILRCVTVRD